MAVALREEVTPSAAEILEQLAKARTRPDDALRAAVGHAAEIAPTIIGLVEKARDSDLDADEDNLLFWGIHTLGAARRKELYKPLMRLVRECPPDELQLLLGDALTATLAKITISVFDGDAAPLVDACADRRVDGLVRWNLIGALARLTFDGAVARETTLAFLDRFDREPLAEPADDAWQGWQDAICLLGLDEMRERLVAAYREDRLLEADRELEAALKHLAVARSLAPGDAGLFVQAHYVPIEDPVKDLWWVTDDEDEASDEDEDMVDPARSFALKQDEFDWLVQFLKGEHLPDDAMTLEEIDGFYCALAMDPNRARAHEYMWAILGSSDETSPFESDEQGSRFADLMNRMWNTIVERFEAGHVHEPMQQDSSAPKGQLWAKGFMIGMQPTQSLWTERLENDEDILTFFDPILKLALDDDEELEGFRMTAEDRAESISVLPPSLLALFGAVQLREQQRRAQPARSTKIGRNEPCPCGSGKKYKKCCGSAEKSALQ